MDSKIQKALEEDGLQITDLTKGELHRLREEIIAKEKGLYVLDGVLWSVRRRKRKEETLEFIREYIKEANG